MNTKILGTKILVIIAHPDDESFLAAGIMDANYKAGGENLVLCVTLGEQGHSYLEKEITEDNLKIIRRQELLDASAHLHAPNVYILNFPDTEVSQHRELLEEQVMKYVHMVKPGLVVSFGEDGYTGHQDHVALSDVVTKVAASLKICFLRFMKPEEEVCKNLSQHLLVKRKNGTYMEICEPANQKLEREVFRIKVNPEFKMQALSLHVSQWKGLNPYNIFPKDVAEHFLNYEYFYFQQQ